jgi:hypothetical protein
MTISDVEGRAPLNDTEGLIERPALSLALAGRDQIAVVAACLIGNMVSPTPIIHGPFGQFLIPISHEFVFWP